MLKEKKKERKLEGTQLRILSGAAQRFLTPLFHKHICWCNEDTPWEMKFLPASLPPFLPSPPAPLWAAPILPTGAVWCRAGGGCPRVGLRSACGGWTQGAVAGVLMNCTGRCCHGERSNFSPPFHPTVPLDQHRKLMVLWHASSGSSSGSRVNTKITRGIFSC